ncbi:MAG: hypothetical protein JSV33_11865 [bacterium]|nr:MAG: hypothetical protein JSV33_11865 [bacterium]
MFDIGERLAFDLKVWKLVLGACLVVVSIVIYRRTFPPLSPSRKAVLTVLRVLAFILLTAFVMNPVLISFSREVKEPLMVVLLDRSKSMGIRNRDGVSRIEEAERQLGRVRDVLHGRSDPRIEVVPFSNELSPVPLPSDSTVRVTGEGTDILGAVTTALKRYRTLNLVAVVLLSDGRISRGMTTTGSRLPVPVYTAGFGDTLEGTDISVVDIIYDRLTYAGAETGIEAVFSATGCAGRNVDIELVQDGVTKSRKRVSIESNDERFDASFQYVPDTEGDSRLVITAVPLDDEEWKENNTESITIKVLKAKIVFLFLDQYADWNMTFLRDLTERTKRFEAEFVTYLPERGFVTVPGMRSWSFPATAAGLSGFDLVIVEDDTRILTDPRAAGVLETYVRAGGSLLVLGGENSPLRWAPAMNVLEDFLPVGSVGAREIETGELAVEAVAGGGMDPVAAALEEHGGLAALPPLTAAVSGLEVTAGARVPLVLTGGRKTYPFFAFQRYGEGLSAVVLGFPLWRWKLVGAGERIVYDAFFSNLIQYLAEGADLPPLEVDSDRTVYRRGDRIRLSVYLRQQRLVEGVRGEVIEQVEGRERIVRTFLFDPDPRQVGMFEAELEELPPGEYRVVAEVVRASGEGLTGDVTISVVPVSVEFMRTSRDNRFLRYIARISGGRFMEGDELPSLVQSLRFEPQEIERRAVRPMRQHPLLFVGVVLLLASEWILRKVWGLV